MTSGRVDSERQGKQGKIYYLCENRGGRSYEKLSTCFGLGLRETGAKVIDWDCKLQSVTANTVLVFSQIGNEISV